MEFEPKYIEDKDIKCKFDDYFIDELITLPLYLDILEIDCNDYLDYINLNQYLK